MKEVKRLQRIVAVRTTQRDISAMRLLEAKRQTRLAREGLAQAEGKLEEASLALQKKHHLTQQDLERMDADRIAAWEEIAQWQQNMINAEQAQEVARSLVEAQHLALRQSERLGERAELSEQRRLGQAERQLCDEQASRGGRGLR